YNHPTIESRNQALIQSSGFYDGKNYHVFDQSQVFEHVKHSWYKDAPAAHPFNEDVPVPLKSSILENTDFAGKYSWAKSPRYMGQAAEAGPLPGIS
ncbi:nickel-dependent hydrogenase large subunit, partial [Mycobacterium tuberculosis]